MSSGAVGWVYEHSPYRGAKLLIHLALGDSANDMHDYELWARQVWIADKARVSRSAVNGALATMVKDGFLKLLEDNSKSGKPNRYRLLMPPMGAVWNPRGVSSETTPGVAGDDTGVSSETTGGVVRDDTEPKGNPRVNPTEETLPAPSSQTEEPDYSAVAREMTTAYWEWHKATKNNRPPAQKFIAIAKVVETALRNGVSREDLTRAMKAADVISGKSLDFELNRQGRGNRDQSFEDRVRKNARFAEQAHRNQTDNEQENQ